MVQRGLIKHYHLLFYPKLGNDVCEISRIPCAYVACTSIIDKPWISGIPSDKQEHYKPVTKCTYCPGLGYFNNWNMIQLSQESTPSDAFDEIHQVFIDGIIENMSSLSESGQYGAIDTTDTETNGFYVIMFQSEAYALQKNTATDVKIITSGELVVKAQYLCSMQIHMNWYCNQHPQQNVITMPKLTILHPQLEVITVTDFHVIPKSVCNSTQARRSISRHPICLTDSDYNYILKEIYRLEKIEFEREIDVYSDDMED